MAPTYGYAPPPPPPSASTQPYPSQSNSGRGGGPSGRGRGGHHTNGHNAQAAPPVHYEYAATHQPYAGQQPQAYGGPQQPHHPSYPQGQPHWPQSASHAPAPMSANTFHPTYASQPYPAAPHYPHEPSYGAQQHYAQPYQAPHAAPQWSSQGPPIPPTYGAGRGRGGFNDRGAAKVGTRGGFEHDQHQQQPSYPPSYSHDPRASYPPPQYGYAAPPPPPPPQASYYDGHQGGSFGRGRGGGHRGGNRGRGGGHRGGRPDQKSRGNDHKPHPQHDKTNDHHNAGRKKKRKTNTLGLTPGMESESEDDEGEEAALEKLLGQERYQVDDVAEFLAERKKNFPTRARAEARKNAELASKTEDEESALHKKRDKLRRQLAKVESSIKRKRDLGDEGDEMRDLSLNDSEEDEKPESMTSKPSAASAPPPAKKADVTRHCKYFSTGGSCGKKSKCRFVHDPAVREAAIKERDANNGRLTIQQRLVLNDQEQEDLAILQSIQYLREKGVMKKENLPVPKEFEKRQTPAPPVAAPLSAPQKTSLLPAASASLPPPPPKREPVGRRDSKNHPKPPASVPKPVVVDAQATNAQNSSAWLNTPYSANGTQPDDLP